MGDNIKLSELLDLVYVNDLDSEPSEPSEPSWHSYVAQNGADSDDEFSQEDVDLLSKILLF